jgi:hypothetical protein
MVQLAPGATLAPQLLVTENGPEVLMPLMVRTPLALS